VRNNTPRTLRRCTRIRNILTSSTGIKAKVENQDQYKQYLEALEGLRQELGVALREELYPGEE
jgi:cytochrome c oxidase subunit 5a